MKNYVGPGQTVQFTSSGGNTSGEPIVLGTGVLGVVANDVADSAVGVAVIDGEFTFTKVAGTAWAVGDKLDWDASESALEKGVTPATGDLTLCAICTEVAASAATTGKARLLPGNGTLN